MGLTIGQTPALLGAQGVRSVRPASFFGAGARNGTRLPGQGDSDDGPVLLGQRNEEPPRVGLGRGTLSGPGAALNAIQQTVREVRETQPTIREINIGFQQSAAIERAQEREQRSAQLFSEGREIRTSSLNAREASVNRVRFNIPEPAAQARNFINTLNEAAGAAQARFSETNTTSESGPSFQVNGQQFPLRSGTGTIVNLTA